jgi:hypothetical protein
MNEINNVLKKHFFNKKFMNCHKKGRNYPRMVGRLIFRFFCFHVGCLCGIIIL